MVRKAQISLEYMILTGFILLVIIVPSAIFLFSFANKSVYGTVSTQEANDIGNGLVDNAKQMYYLGLYSKKTVSYDIPDNVKEFFILELTQPGTGKKYYYIGIIIDNGKDESKHFFPSDVPLMSAPLASDSDYMNAFNADNSVYINECTPDICKFYNFVGPAAKPGKKQFKLETKYDSTSGNEVKVNIMPLIE
jgi:uncharacterized protein (UPF0333 family)